MLWDEWIPPSFYKCLCESERFIYLNGKNVLYPQTSEIVNKSVKEDVMDNYENMRAYLNKKYKIIQYVYGLLFLIIYKTGEIRGVNLKGELQLKFKGWNNKKAQKTLEKILKLIKKEFKQWIRKRPYKDWIVWQWKRRWDSKKILRKKSYVKSTLKKAKEAKNHALEKQLWARFGEINSEFSAINNIKRKNQKKIKKIL